jgi:hypothetical protein
MVLLSMGSSDESGSNEDGSSVFDHYVCFVVSGLIKFKQKIGEGKGNELRSTKTRSRGGMRPAGGTWIHRRGFYIRAWKQGCAVAMTFDDHVKLVSSLPIFMNFILFKKTPNIHWYLNAIA